LIITSAVFGAIVQLVIRGGGGGGGGGGAGAVTVTVEVSASLPFKLFATTRKVPAVFELNAPVGLTVPPVAE
jgi:hypothetical protein